MCATSSRKNEKSENPIQCCDEGCRCRYSSRTDSSGSAMRRADPRSVARGAPRGSLRLRSGQADPVPLCITSRLARASAMTFCVWRAIPLMRNRGEPSGVSAYGMTEANGQPACSAECVARVPMRSVSRSVRTRSAKVGSGAVGGGWVDWGAIPGERNGGGAGGGGGEGETGGKGPAGGRGEWGGGGAVAPVWGGGPPGWGEGGLGGGGGGGGGRRGGGGVLRHGF